MFNQKQIDARVWLLVSFILIACLMVGQAYIEDKNEDQSQDLIKQAYKQGNLLQLNTKDLSAAFYNQITAMKELLLHGKDPDLYHIYLSKYYTNERETVEQLDKTILLLPGNDQFKLLLWKISDEYRALSKQYREAIRVFNASDERAHIFADRLLDNSDKLFISLLNSLSNMAARLQQDEINKLQRESEKRNLYSWIVIVLLSTPFIIFLYIILDKKVKALHDSEARYQRAEQGTNDGLWEWNIVTGVDYFSPRWLGMLGYKPGELAYHVDTFIDLIHPDDKSVVQAAIEQHLQNDKPFNVEMRLCHKCGDYVWVNSRGQAERNDKGDPSIMAGFVTDITERKQVSLELSRFKNTLDQTLDCVFMFDADNLKFFYVNEGALQQVGYTRDELLTMHPYDIKPEIVESQFHEIIAPLLSGKQASISFETVHQHKDGQQVPVEIFLQFIKHEEEPGRFVAIVRDISERKQAEVKLAQYHDHLEELVEERTKALQDAHDELVRKERLATLGQLTATVSHELRNPLGAMRPSLYVIDKKSDKEDERVQKAIERVDRNIDRCDHIIDELLDFTRITELNRHPTRIDEWLESVIDEQEIPEDILLEKDLPLKDVELAIDTDRLRRAVINVVENACHAMLDDKKQVINKESARLVIKTRGNNERVEIVITDTGTGIPEDVLSKIYEPLFSTKGFGVGLGMPTVKQILEQHGGGIEIDTEEDKGTTVTLWLPCVQSDEVAARAWKS